MKQKSTGSPRDMDRDQVRELVAGLDPETKKRITDGPLRKPLIAAITAIGKSLKAPGAVLTPAPSRVFEAFRKTPWASIRVILLGQDPYPKAGEATGLSFDSGGSTTPPSLKAIYAALVNSGQVAATPKTNDLSRWAAQGVLLLNAALTTLLGKSDAHTKIWAEYTLALIRELAQHERPLIFILLGTKAHRFAQEILEATTTEHRILCWGHPSPLNTKNQSDNPLHFKYCTVFSRTNEILIERGEPPINWDPAAVDETPPEPLMEEPTAQKPEEEDQDHGPLRRPDDPKSVWLFVDGGATGNGMKHAKASYAYLCCVGQDLVGLRASYSEAGPVPEVQQDGKTIKPSNGRGEISAARFGFERLCELLADHHPSEIRVICDATYTIGVFEKWYRQWAVKPKLRKDKKNLDLIDAAWPWYLRLCEIAPVVFEHQPSHQEEPAANWYRWRGNQIVDQMCDQILEPDPKK